MINVCPLVSIIMPLYNASAFVKDSIRSVLCQTYENFELLVVDDCSTDDSLEAVRSFSDSRIILLTSPSHQGAAAARNLALKASRGSFIAFLDSDDLWEHHKLERQIKFMEENHFAFSCTYSKGVRDSESVYVETCPLVVTRRMLLKCDYISCLTVVAEKSLFDSVSVRPDIKRRNDYALWIQIIEKADCHCLPEILAFYRIRQNSLSHRNKFSLLKDHYLLWSKQFHKSFFCAWFYALRNAFYTEFIKKRKFRRFDKRNQTEK